MNTTEAKIGISFGEQAKRLRWNLNRFVFWPNERVILDTVILRSLDMGLDRARIDSPYFFCDWTGLRSDHAVAAIEDLAHACVLVINLAEKTYQVMQDGSFFRRRRNGRAIQERIPFEAAWREWIKAQERSVLPSGRAIKGREDMYSEESIREALSRTPEPVTYSFGVSGGSGECRTIDGKVIEAANVVSAWDAGIAPMKAVDCGYGLSLTQGEASGPGKVTLPESGRKSGALPESGRKNEGVSLSQGVPWAPNSDRGGECLPESGSKSVDPPRVREQIPESGSQNGSISLSQGVKTAELPESGSGAYPRARDVPERLDVKNAFKERTTSRVNVNVGGAESLPESGSDLPASDLPSRHWTSDFQHFVWAEVRAFVGDRDAEKYWRQPVQTDPERVNSAVQACKRKVREGVKVLKNRGAFLFDEFKRQRAIALEAKQ